MTLAEACLRALPALVAVLLLGRMLGALLKKLGQPAVIGEVVAGILLGPSLLGAESAALLLPAESAPALKLLALLGVTLYMFRVGLQLDIALVRQRLKATLWIAHAGIAAPLLLGVLIGLPLYADHAGSTATPLLFSLFLGVALSITAFPVLARILADVGLLQHPIGQMALGAAAVGDVTAWCLLAALTGVASTTQGHAAWWVIAGSLGYVALMLLVLKPVLPRLYASTRHAALLILLALLAASATATQWLGLHASFGAFLLGSLLPRGEVLTRRLDTGLEMPARWLLPAFFAYAGMRTRLDLIVGWEDWGLCLGITLVATLGKVGGSWLAARACGESPRAAAALGALMNARGLMELIVLQIGFDLGLISQRLFSMLVVMALVTTLSTVPLLRLLGPASLSR